VARANALSNGVADRIELRQGDLLTPLTAPVEVVVANLPYLRPEALAELAGERTSLAYEPRVAVVAGADGLSLLRRAIAELPRVLARGGAAFFEVDPAQSRTVAQLLEATLGGAVRLTRDLAGEARVVASSRL